MAEREVRNELLRILNEKGIPTDGIPDDTLLEDLGIDSLDSAEIDEILQDRGYKVDMRRTADFKTFGDYVRYMEELGTGL